MLHKAGHWHEFALGLERIGRWGVTIGALLQDYRNYSVISANMRVMVAFSHA